MNVPSSPISGLSTVIHLLIILLAEILIAAKLFWQKHVTGHAGANFDSVAANARIAPAWVKRALSIIIVLFMLAVMVSLSTLTILKAMKLRAEESQSQYIQQTAMSIWNAEINWPLLVYDNDKIMYTRAESAESHTVVAQELILK